MVSGLSNGIAAIRPVETVDETFELGDQGYVMAGERGGQIVEGFDIGNSPFDYLDDELVGRKVAISTTNGSRTILHSLQADEILIGAFLNFSASVAYLQQADNDILIHCAGWKGTVNLEDTLYAGALAQALQHAFRISGDSAQLALELYRHNQNNLLALAKKSSHAERLAGFGVLKDIEFCMQFDHFASVIALDGDHLVKI